MTKAEALERAAWALFEVVRLEVEMVPDEGLAWSELTDGQREGYRRLIRQAVDHTAAQV